MPTEMAKLWPALWYVFHRDNHVETLPFSNDVYSDLTFGKILWTCWTTKKMKRLVLFCKILWCLVKAHTAEGNIAPLWDHCECIAREWRQKDEGISSAFLYHNPCVKVAIYSKFLLLFTVSMHEQLQICPYIQHKLFVCVWSDLTWTFVLWSICIHVSTGPETSGCLYTFFFLWIYLKRKLRAKISLSFSFSV